MLDRSCAWVHMVEPDSTLALRWEQAWQAAGIRIARYLSREAFLRDYHPRATECLVAELQLPNDTGLSLLQQVLTQHWAIPIVATSPSPDPQLIVTAMQSGAIDFFAHTLEDDQTLAKIEHALDVDWEAKQAHGNLAAKLMLLSPREDEVLDQLLTAANTIQIAHRLGICAKTVEKHRSNIFNKLHVSSVPELMRLIWQPSVPAITLRYGAPIAATPIPQLTLSNFSVS